MSNEIEIIGCMDHTLDHTFESANRVYSPEGIAPTIPTCAGGGIQPKILEVIPMNVTTTRCNDIANTIRASYYKNGERNVIENMESGKGYEGVIEYKCVAMRGRDDGQQFEIRDEDVVNTITTVQKDNYMLEEIKIKQATKDGSIPIDISGGGSVQLRLSEQQNKTRKSNRERKYMPDIDNGEYP